ncbi:MAG: DUF1987 domain-containing protein [Fulvivirga sp.]|nr:DUF1987 domain-containing protein [Fulvivirga sp.]
MEKLLIEATDDSPKIFLNGDRGILQFKGRSFMEDTSSYSVAIIQWLRDYMKNPQTKSIIDLEFEYVNSASHRMISEFMNEVNKYYILGNDFEVIWRCPAEDETLIEFGEELNEILEISIKFDFTA